MSILDLIRMPGLPMDLPGWLAASGETLVRSGVVLYARTGLLLLGALLAAWLLSRRGPAVATLLYRSALIATFACALLCGFNPDAARPLYRIVLPPSQTVFTEAIRLPSRLPGSGFPPAAGAVGPLAPTQPERAPADRTGAHGTPAFRPLRNGDLYGILGAVWALGACLQLIRLLAAQAMLGWCRRQCRPVTNEPLISLLQALCDARGVRTPELLAGAAVRTPFLAGIRRPAIFLPVSFAEELDACSQRAILTHELAHLARRDCAWIWLGRLTCAVLWGQPLVWILFRRMERASEDACDLAVLEAECSPQAYARCLVGLAERMRSSSLERSAGVAVLASRSQLARRVERILAGSARRASPLSRPARRAAVGLSGVALMAAWWIFSAGPAAMRAGAGPDGETQARGVIVGRLVRSDGAPIAGVFVRALRRPDRVDAHGEASYNGDSPVPISSAAASGSDGRFALRGVGTAAYIVTVVPKQDLELVTGARPTVAALDRETVSVGDIVMTPGAVVQGIVRDDRSGRPVEGARIVAGMAGAALDPGVIPPAIQTDVRGRFAVRVAPGRIALTVLSPESRQRSGAASPESPRREITVAEGARETVDLRVDGVRYAGGILTGRVVLPDGRPAPGVRVMAQIHESAFQGITTSGQGVDSAFSWAEGSTGRDGAYRLAGLGHYRYNVAVEDPSGQWVAAAQEGVMARPGQALPRPDLVLTPGAVVAGTVTSDADGRPVPGVYVASYGPHRPRSSAMVINCKTDANGRYRLRVAPGRSYIYCMEGENQPGVNLEIAPGETREVPLRMRGAAPDREETPADGNPPAGSNGDSRGKVDGVVSAVGGHPDDVLPPDAARARAQGVTCLSNLRQLALAALMFTADHRWRLALNAADYRAKLLPYHRMQAIYRCPLDAPGDGYTLNVSLAGVRLDALRAPERTVLFYEGRNGRPEFRHAGTTYIAFADGHVKRTSRAAAAQLLWKP